MDSLNSLTLRGSQLENGRISWVKNLNQTALTSLFHSDPKTHSRIFRCQTLLTSNRTCSMVRLNIIKSFAHRDKKYPMSTVKCTARSFMLWVCFSARPHVLVSCSNTASHLIKYQQRKNLNPTASARNLIIGCGWMLNKTAIQN